jgi:hypothetical protein
MPCGRADRRNHGAAHRCSFGDPQDMLLFARARRASPLSGSDRMGYRLIGPRLAHAKGHNHRLRRHRQRAYPDTGQRPAAGAARRPGDDRRLSENRLHRDGRSRAPRAIPVGGGVRFKAIPVEVAQAEARRLQNAIRSLRGEMDADLSGLSSEALFSANLAGDAVNAMDS